MPSPVRVGGTGPSDRQDGILSFVLLYAPPSSRPDDPRMGPFLITYPDPFLAYKRCRIALSLFSYTGRIEQGSMDRPQVPIRDPVQRHMCYCSCARLGCKTFSECSSYAEYARLERFGQCMWPTRHQDLDSMKREVLDAEGPCCSVRSNCV